MQVLNFFLPALERFNEVEVKKFNLCSISNLKDAKNRSEWKQTTTGSHVEILNNRKIEVSEHF